MNQGVCEESENDFVCLCKHGFRGQRCEGKYDVLAILSVFILYIWLVQIKKLGKLSHSVITLIERRNI